MYIREVSFVVGRVTFLGRADCTRKTRIIDVVYNASNMELVRTKVLVKNAIVVVDAAPFKQWYDVMDMCPKDMCAIFAFSLGHVLDGKRLNVSKRLTYLREVGLD